MRHYPMDTQEDAHASRNRVWDDHAAGTISTGELFEALGKLRLQWGEALYDRPGREPLRERRL